MTACASSATPVASPSSASVTASVPASDAQPDDGATVPGSSTASTGPGPTTGSSGSSVAPGVRPEGFETTLARVTTSDGSVCEFCVWLADTAPQRSLGLMFVTDLGAAEAMAFRYPEPHTGTFWMKNTVLPLSIAFFAPDGGFLSSFDMAPCESDPCPNYRTPADFSIAVEVPRGGLADLGLAAGSTLELLDLPCAP